MKVLLTSFLVLLLCGGCAAEDNVQQDTVIQPVKDGISKDLVGRFAAQFIDVLKGKRTAVDVDAYANLEAVAEIAQRESRKNNSEPMSKASLVEFRNGITKKLENWILKNKESLSNLKLEAERLSYLCYSARVNETLTFDAPTCSHMVIYVQYEGDVYAIKFHEIYFINGMMVLGGGGEELIKRVSK